MVIEILYDDAQVTQICPLVDFGAQFLGAHQIFLSPIQICLYGRHVFMGYLYDEEKTIGYVSNQNAETLDTWIDSDGWLHSGDIGKIEVSIITASSQQFHLNF